MATTTKPIILDETGIRIASALEAGLNPVLTMTITATASDSVPVTGQTIVIKDIASGLNYQTIIYNGQPVTLNIPYGMSYQVIPNCTLSMHYCEDRPSGIANNNVSILLTYSAIGTLNTFPQLKAALNADLGKYIPIGTQISFTHSVYGNLVYDIMNFNKTSQSMLLVQHNTLANNMQFDAPEANYRPVTQMAAGDYTMKLGSTSYYFTLTSPIPAGGQLRVVSTQFWAYEDAYDVVGIETGSVSTTAIAGATDLGTTGSGNINHYDRVQYGSNNYAESALGRWVDSSDAANEWWDPATQFDRPVSYTGIAGFKNGVPADVLECIDTISVKCYNTATYTAPDSQYAKNYAYSIDQQFFLLSEKEVYGSAIYDDGTKQLDAYVGTDNTAKIKKYNNSPQYWWLRSPHSSAHGGRYVTSSGSANGYYSSNSYGVVPACVISKSA